jgi:hypothetical protein
MAVNIKIPVFLDVTPCNLVHKHCTNVSENSTYQIRYQHFPQNHNPLGTLNMDETNYPPTRPHVVTTHNPMVFSIILVTFIITFVPNTYLNVTF